MLIELEEVVVLLSSRVMRAVVDMIKWYVWRGSKQIIQTIFYVEAEQRRASTTQPSLVENGQKFSVVEIQLRIRSIGREIVIMSIPHLQCDPPIPSYKNTTASSSPTPPAHPQDTPARNVGAVSLGSHG